METIINIIDIKNLIRKALTRMVFPSQYAGLLTLPRTKFDYGKEVYGYQSAIVMACINWIQRTFPEAPIYLRQRNRDGTWEDFYEHAMIELLETPNPYYDGLLLEQATIADLNIDGNAYWRKIRSKANRVVQLWWIPSPLIEPRWGFDNTQYITHYDYRTGALPEKLPIEDIVHFRYGLDPNNIRKGLSPLKSLFREVFTDDEAANMTAALLRNVGVPGVIISPKESQGMMGKGAADEVKAYFKEMFTGDKRGEPLVMSAATEVRQFGFSPQQLDMKALRRIPEERISGVLGIPAIVAGLGAGLDHSTFANFGEAREMAYESNIIPSQRLFGSVIRRQLLTEFESDISGWQVAFDLSEVRVLEEDENKLALRIGQMVRDGFITVADAQRETGMPIDETQNIYLRALNLIEVPAGFKPAKDKKETKSDTEEQKILHWKRIDSRRVAWWRAAEQTIIPLYEKENKAIQKAIKDKSTDDLVKAAQNAIQGFESQWFKGITALDLELIQDFGQEVATDMGGLPKGISYPKPDGIKWRFDPFSIAIQKWLSGHAAESVTSILETNLVDVKKVITAGVQANMTTPQIAKELRQFYDDRSPYKAMRVARTEVASAAGFGQHEAAIQSGVVKFKRWLSSRDDRVRDSHQEMDGEEQPLNEPYSNGLMFTGDPSGLPEETIMCILPGGRIRIEGLLAASKSRYKGPALELITINGRHLSVTPNHPILTNRGFILAQYLRPGDNLVCDNFREGMLGVNEHIADIPATIEEVYGSLSDNSVQRYMRHGTVFDFHGDGRFSDGNIEIVVVNSQLGRAFDTPLFKPLGNDNLSSGNIRESLLASDSPADAFCIGAFPSLTCNMGGGSPCATLPRGHKGHRNNIRLATISGCDTSSEETPLNNAPIYLELSSQFQDRFASLITCDKILQIRDFKYSGHVYNLQSISGLYTCNGIFVKNCRCAEQFFSGR